MSITISIDFSGSAVQEVSLNDKAKDFNIDEENLFEKIKMGELLISILEQKLFYVDGSGIYEIGKVETLENDYDCEIGKVEKL